MMWTDRYIYNYMHIFIHAYIIYRNILTVTKYYYTIDRYTYKVNFIRLRINIIFKEAHMEEKDSC